MKPKFRSLFAVCVTSTLLFSASAVPASAQGVDKIKVEHKGANLQLGQDPFIQDNRTFVPLRSIFEEIGATIQWDAATNTVTATKDDVTVKLTIGSKIAYRNNAQVELDAPAMIRGGRAFVPVRFIAESFNTPVSWDSTTKTVRLLDSNRARLEELLSATSTEVRSMHVDGTINGALKDKQLGNQTFKAGYDLDYDYDKDTGLLNLHTLVKPNFPLALMFDKVEAYVKNNQFYYYDPTQRAWFTSPIPTDTTSQAQQPTAANIKKIAKYAILDEQADADVITFYLDSQAMQDLPGAQQQLPVEVKMPVMKMVVKLDKKTQILKTFDIDMKMVMDTSSTLDFHIDAKTSKINEPVTITLPEEVKQAKPAEIPTMK